MIEIIPFLKENSDWIKDISTMVFAATGTVIAVLSYKKAKSSIFQPKRTEVTKIQTELLLDFLSKFTTDGNSIDQAIDYRNLLSYNIDLALRDYNLSDKFSSNSTKYKELNTNIAGWYDDPGDINSVAFTEGNLYEYDKFFRKEKSENDLENGEINLTRIFVTKRHYYFIKKLTDLSSHPFLNKEIQDAANRIGENLTINIQQKLKRIIEDQILEIYKYNKENSKVNDTDLNVKIKYAVMWTLFELDKIKHSEDYDLLIKEIRNHLMVDEKW